MKKAVAVTALCILLVLVPICTVYASQPFYYSMDIPAAITLKKSAQAKLCLSSPSGVQLGTAVFTVRYDPNVLTYKEADIADGMPGEMRAVEDGGLVKIVYLNANGTTLPRSEATPMILLRFTALSTQCKTTLTLYTEQAVDINEQKMTVQDPIEYQVTLQEKETTSSASASGRRVSASSAGSASSGVGSILVEGGAQEQPQLLENGSYASADTLTIGGQGQTVFGDSGFVLFLCGVAAAVIVIVIVAVAYTAGLHRKKEQAEGANAGQTKEQDEQAENTRQEKPEKEETEKNKGDGV